MAKSNYEFSVWLDNEEFDILLNEAKKFGYSFTNSVVEKIVQEWCRARIKEYADINKDYVYDEHWHGDEK